MNEIEVPEFDKLRIIYNEIISGCSFSENFYIKHLTEPENAEIVKYRHSAFQRYKEDGLPTLKEKLAELEKDELWTKKDEDKIEELKTIISDNEKNLKTIIPQMRPAIEKILQDHQMELIKLLSEKSHLVGRTADDQAEQDSYNILIYLSFFKDKNLNIRVFDSISDVEELDEESIKFTRILNNTFKNLSSENIRKISVLPFFLNSFGFCRENLYSFLGKPIFLLTASQLNLFSLGNRNLQILEKADGSPPEVSNDVKIQDIIDWYDLQYSIALGKSQTGTHGITKSVKEVRK